MTLPYGFIYEMDEPLRLVTGFGPVVRSRDGRGPEAGATQRRVRGVLPDGGEGDGLLWPRWSPDGTKIAYAQGRDVYVVDVATSRSRLVTRGGAPEWFDDDTLIVSRG